MTNRQGFSTRIGFVLAAGSAVGLGNVWGFPTQVANHGGGAFILVYFAFLLLLAIPALYAELSIGYRERANPVIALEKACPQQPVFGRTIGWLNVLGAIMMLSFYSIIAGWMFSHGLANFLVLLGLEQPYNFLTQSGLGRNAVFSLLVMCLTA